MIRCKYRGVVFGAYKLVAFSEKLVNIDQQKIVTRGNYPSAGEDTNAIKICSNVDSIYLYLGNLSMEKIDSILESVLKTGYLNIDKLNLQIIVDEEDKIVCYEKNVPYVYISTYNYQRLADDTNESVEYRTMDILDEDEESIFKFDEED